jgi:hypothetical protein
VNWNGFSLLACTALAGCLSVESSSITTQGMHADLTVEADGTGQSLASAELTVGGDLSNVYVDLVGGDQLVASEGQVSRIMTRQNDVIGRVWYEAVLPTDAEGTEFHIALERPPGSGVSAPDSVVVLPAGFDITAPAPGTSQSRGAALTVTWQPGRADSMTIEVSGFCIAPALFGVPPNATSYTIGASQLRALDGQPPSSCDIGIVIVRSRAGSVDPAFGEGGSFEARQVRSVTVVSVP